MANNLLKILGLAGTLMFFPGNSMERNFVSGSGNKGYEKINEMKFNKGKVKLYEGPENYKIVFPGFEIYGNPGGSIDSMYLDGKKVEKMRDITSKYAEERFNSSFMDFYDKKRNR